jgi:hypothetical protein
MGLQIYRYVVLVLNEGNRDILVGIATGWTARVRFPAVLDFSLLHSVQIGSGANPSCYPMGTDGSFTGVKRQGREADLSPPTSAKVKSARMYNLLPSIFMV